MGELKMKYNGHELEPITTPQIFDPPKEMLVWNENWDKSIKKFVYAITNSANYPIITDNTCFDYCAEIPDEPKPKRATNIQFMEWLSKGNGMWKRRKDSSTIIFNFASFDEESFQEDVDDDIIIHPFGSDEWLEPTLQNMGMEE
jgi:hypothetical protein